MVDVFFGLQLAVQSPAHDPWRSRLSSVVRQHVRDLPLADKRGLWGSVGNLLLDSLDRCALGFWDFVPDGKPDYDDWPRDDDLHGADGPHRHPKNTERSRRRLPG